MMETPSDRFVSIMMITFILLFPALMMNATGFSGYEYSMTRQETVPSSEFTFFNYTLYQESSLVYRAGVGDLIPERDGIEMATCSVDGVVSVHYGSGLSWTTETAHRSYFGDNSLEKAKVFSLDIGDLIPERAGDEIVAVDEDRSVYLVYWGGSGWISDLIFKESDWLYEVDIGNIYGDPEQPEIVIVGENRTVTVLSRVETGWEWEVLHQYPYYLDTCFIADIFPDKVGNEIISAGGSGTVTVLYRENGEWKNSDIYSFGSSIRVLDIICIDMDPRYDGIEVIAATYDKKIMSVYRSSGGWDAQVIHDEGNLVYCLEYGNLINGSLTVAAATWNGRVGLIHYDGKYNFREVYREEHEMYGCIIADIDPSHKGNELVSLSRLGRITMIYRDDPGAVIDLPFERTTVHPEETTRIPFIVRYKGGYQGSTILTSSSGTLSVDSIEGTSISVLSFTAPESEGNMIVEISAVSDTMTDVSSITVIVEEESIPVTLGPSVIYTEVGADRQVEEIFYGFSNETLNEAMRISAIKVPKGLTTTLSRSLCEPCETRDFLSVIVSAASWTDPDIYQFFIIGSSQGAMQRAIAVSIRISERNLADLIMLLDEDDIIIDIGETHDIDLRLISINGFNEQTEIVIDSVPPAIEVNSSKSVIVPTDNLTLTVTGVSAGGPFILVIQGKGVNTTRYAELRVEVVPPPPDLMIDLPSETPVYNTTDNGLLEVEFNIVISPTYGVIENVLISPKIPSDNFTIEIERSELQRVPYSIEIGIRISGRREDVPDHMVFDVSFEGPMSPKEASLNLIIPEKPGREENSPDLLLIIIPIFILIAIASAGFYLYFSNRKSNHLNRNYDHQETDGGRTESGGRHHISSESHETGKPDNKRRGRSGRMDHQH